MARGAEQERAAASAKKDRTDRKKKKAREDEDTSTDSDDERAAEREAERERERERERKGADWKTQRKLSILWIARLKRLRPRPELKWLSWLQSQFVSGDLNSIVRVSNVN